jgi:hypothetical protein
MTIPQGDRRAVKSRLDSRQLPAATPQQWQHVVNHYHASEFIPKIFVKVENGGAQLDYRRGCSHPMLGHTFAGKATEYVTESSSFIPPTACPILT